MIYDIHGKIKNLFAFLLGKAKEKQIVCNCNCLQQLGCKPRLQPNCCKLFVLTSHILSYTSSYIGFLFFILQYLEAQLLSTVKKKI